MRRRAVIGAAALALALAPVARADYDPLGGGTTKIQLDKGFRAFLQKDRIRLDASAPARFRNGSLAFPVSGGSLDPTTGNGEIENEGAVILRNSRKRVPLRGLVVKTTHAPLVAKIGGSQLKVATAAAIGSRREGFGRSFRARSLKLTAKVATRLNKKLRPPVPFAAGQILGELTSAPQPSTVTILPTGRATVALDAAFLAKLDEHFVSVNPIFPAEHQGGTFTFPIIANGALAPDGAAGVLRTGGELEFLRLGSGQVFWQELWFDLGAGTALAQADLEPTPAYAGKLGQVPVMGLGAGAFSPDPSARTLALSGAPLSLTASMATAFDAAFAEGREAFGAGELVGTLSFSAQGQ